MTRRASGLVLGALLALLVLILPGAVSADAPPVILDVRLDDDNHAVVTWTKTASQTSNNVKRTTDGTLGSYRDGSYGAPLADCATGLRSNPARDSAWLYGRSCKGDDVPSTATRHVTRGELQVGVYDFQVSVAGNAIHESGVAVSAVPHYSNIFKLTVLPAQGGGEDATPDDAQAFTEATVAGTVYVSNAIPRSGKVTIEAGDLVDTGAAPAKLTLPDGSALALDKHTRVMFPRAGITQVERGGVWYSLKGAPKVFFKRVRVTDSGVAPQPRAATFTVQHLGIDRSRVRVYEGAARVAGLSRRGLTSPRRVAAGLETLVRRNHAPSRPAKLTPEPAFWR